MNGLRSRNRIREGRRGPMLVALVLSLAVACAPSPPAGEATDIQRHFFNGERVLGVPPAPPIDLDDQHGRPFRLGEQSDVALLFFGYVYCPDVCPTTLSMWARAAKLLGESREETDFVFVTVDPARDTPQRLGAHVAVFGRDFIALTGEPAALARVYDAYGIVREEIRFFESATGYLVEHTPDTFLVAPRHGLRLRYPYGTSAEPIAEDVRWLLDHPPADPALQVTRAWSRPGAAAGGGPGVVYLSIANAGERDDRLVAARAEVCGQVEIHRTTVEEGRMRMEPVTTGVTIDAGETVEFAPGGLHVMLLGLRRDLSPGDRFDVTLQFATAGEIVVPVEVVQP